MFAPSYSMTQKSHEMLFLAKVHIFKAYLILNDKFLSVTGLLVWFFVLLLYLPLRTFHKVESSGVDTSYCISLLGYFIQIYSTSCLNLYVNNS